MQPSEDAASELRHSSFSSKISELIQNLKLSGFLLINFLSIFFFFFFFFYKEPLIATQKSSSECRWFRFVFKLNLYNRLPALLFASDQIEFLCPDNSEDPSSHHSNNYGADSLFKRESPQTVVLWVFPYSALLVIALFLLSCSDTLQTAVQTTSN